MCGFLVSIGRVAQAERKRHGEDPISVSRGVSVSPLVNTASDPHHVHQFELNHVDRDASWFISLWQPKPPFYTEDSSTNQRAGGKPVIRIQAVLTLTSECTCLLAELPGL